MSLFEKKKELLIKKIQLCFQKENKVLHDEIRVLKKIIAKIKSGLIVKIKSGVK